MAQCNINNLLADGKCFAALPPFLLEVVIAQMWCDISGGVVPPASVPSWFNPDLEQPLFNPDEGEVITNPDI